VFARNDGYAGNRPDFRPDPAFQITDPGAVEAVGGVALDSDKVSGRSR
jgi:hypothetical protein